MTCKLIMNKIDKIKVIFLRVRFWRFCTLFRFTQFSCPQSWVPYCRCDPNKEWQIIFKIGKPVLYFNLLRIAIFCLNFEFTQLTCFVYNRCSSNNIPRYFTVLIGLSLLPLSLNFWHYSLVSVFRLKDDYLSHFNI